MRLGGFVATYKRPAKLQETLNLLTHQTVLPDTILVVDNASSPETEAIANAFRSNGVVYEPMSDNLGSAGGTAYGAQWLFDRGFDFIYFGDDDDPPKTEDTIERLMRMLAQSDATVAGVGAVGARWDWKKGELRRFSDEDLTAVMEVDVVGGNHHLIVRREGVEKFGVPNSRLFFGYPDVEYCLRIRKAGYRLLVDGDLMRIHREKTNRLNVQRRRSIIPPRPYRSIWRNYYTTRNYINMMKRTFNRPDLAVRESLKAILRVPVSWIRGPKYGAAFSRLQLRAIWDGYVGKMGRTIMPGDK
jgi:GT2 family glycosyltransferase